MKHIAMMACLAAALAACGNTDNSKVEKEINSALTKNTPCTNIPIGLPLDLSKVGSDGALGILKAKGYVAEGKIEFDTYRGKSSADALLMTEKGKPLLQTPAAMGRYTRHEACIRTGRFEVGKVEAIDFGNDIEGKPIASVRARIKFVPEEWIADTRKDAAWSGFWKGIDEKEGGTWLYQLLKSGNEFYSHGQGRKIQ